MNWKPSQLLALASWASVFVLSWPLLKRSVPADVMSWGFFAFFLLIAVMSSAVSSGRRKDAG